MAATRDERLIALCREAAHPLRGVPRDGDALLDLIGDASIVVIGSGSAGTRELQRCRNRLTRRLVEERGFGAIALDADAADAERLDRFVGGLEPGEVSCALDGFTRFPAWTVRNRDVAEIMTTLRDRTRRNGRGGASPVRIFGLDRHCFARSAEIALRHLARRDPAAAARARYRFSCFDHFGEDPEAFGYATAFALDDALEESLVDALARAGGYDRGLFGRRIDAWNRRTRELAERLEEIRRDVPKIVVWTSNAQGGDARATELGVDGEVSLGQLLRERHGGRAILVGCTTHAGTVTAASDWEAPAERKRLRPSMSGSYERIFHETGLARFSLVLRDGGECAEALAEPRGERCVGAVYRPESEATSHCFHASLAEQFDAVVHIDVTRAITPIDRTPIWEMGELPLSLPAPI
jgi:erythromycin esterase-like protein